MDESLEKGLLDMEARGRALRAQLAAAGEANERHHQRLEELNRANASRLRQIIAVLGWPGVTLVGEKGAQAAWRIAMHAVAEPDFMRHCRNLIEAASERQEVPRWQFAILDDRIRVYEGRPQRFGTQLRHGPQGLEPHPIENEARVNGMRMQAGLPPLAPTLAKARAQPQPPDAEIVRREAAEREFRRSVGWMA